MFSQIRVGDQIQPLKSRGRESNDNPTKLARSPDVRKSMADLPEPIQITPMVLAQHILPVQKQHSRLRGAWAPKALDRQVGAVVDAERLLRVSHEMV